MSSSRRMSRCWAGIQWSPRPVSGAPMTGPATGQVSPYSGSPSSSRSAGTPSVSYRSSDQRRLRSPPSDRSSGAEAPGEERRDAVVVAHQEDPVGARVGRDLGHRGPGRARRRWRPRPSRRRSALEDGRPQPLDERPVRGHERRVEDLDVDVDPVDAGLVHEVDEALDDRVLALDVLEQARVPPAAEARVDELDARAPLVRLARSAAGPRSPVIARSRAGVVLIAPRDVWVTLNSASVVSGRSRRCASIPSSISQYGR